MKETFKWVLPLLKKHYKKYVVGFIVLLCVDGIQLFIPKIIQRTIDAIAQVSFTKHDILVNAGYILLLSAAMVFFRYWWRVLIMGSSWQIERDLRQQYYDHLVTLSRNFYNKSKIGDLMAHATNDLNSVRMLFGMSFVALSDIVLLLFASFFFMVSINLKLSLVAIVPLPIMTLVIPYIGRKMHRRFTKVQESFSDLSATAQETISGIRVVKAFSQEKSEEQRMEKDAYNYVRQNIKLAIISGFFHPFMGFVVSISMGIVLVYGGIITVKGEITPGEFIAFFSYLGMLVWPMMAIGMVVNFYQMGTASLKRLNAIFEQEAEIKDEESDFSLTSLQGNLELRELSFRYADELPEIFQKISVTVKQGETLAIVGRTGCGKSTFLDLLTRVYNPPRQSIFYDGIDIYQIPLKTLRKAVIMVPQDIFLFSDTIFNNIALGKPKATTEEIENAARIAQVYEDIMGFSEGFETIVGERGVTLSGGQKQRIAIARALVCDPTLLILDDSLSAVDTKTEKHILSELIKLRKHKTTIIVAHRVSSIEHADKIIVLEEGKISESGNHNELIALNGYYQELYERQQIEQKLEEK